MKTLAEKFAQIERRVAAEKGEFSLFALFLREDAPGDQWDVIVAAPWIGEDKKEALQLLAAEIKSHLRTQDVVKLSRMVLLDPEDASVRDFNEAVQVEHGSVELRDREIFGLPIRHAYIITSRADLQAAA